jgi:hypothetical protein
MAGSSMGRRRELRSGGYRPARNLLQLLRAGTGMKQSKLRSIGRWISLVGVAFVLAACGGGGGGGDGGTVATPTPTPPAPVADARNGTYTLMGVNAREYALSLDFDAKTYRVAGNGVDQSGAITASGNEFRFEPGNSTGATGTSTTRFTVADNTVVGEVGLPEGAVPFIAPRAFETTLAGAVGRYNMLGRTLNADGSLNNTSIQQGEITADGHLRTCEDNRIFEIASCPSSSVVSGTVTVAGDLYTSETPVGNILFRIAKMDGEKLFVRASISGAGARRFMIGTPAVTSFAPDTFVGGTSEPAWGTMTIASGSTSSTFTFTVTGTSPTGVTTTRTGTATALGVPGGDTLASLLGVTTADAGNFFVIRSADIGAVIAARGSTLSPGFIAIGKRQ